MKPELKLVNMEHLARGTGAMYIVVIEAHIPGIYIAARWLRKPEKAKLKKGELIYDIRAREILSSVSA